MCEKAIKLDVWEVQEDFRGVKGIQPGTKILERKAKINGIRKRKRFTERHFSESNCLQIYC